VNDSSSSATNPVDPLRADLLRAGRLAPLASAYLRGEHRDLLAPLHYLESGALPPLPTFPGGQAPDRRALAEGLGTANASYGHPRGAELARKLADPATAVVVTGQQPGLLGGPLYALSKMVAAARWAAALEAAGQPAVAVFWVATEDHDFQEVAKATLLTREGPASFALDPNPHALMPVGMVALGAGIDRVLAEMGDAMPGDRYAAWLATLGRWYRPLARIGEAFCRLAVHLLGERAPLILDAMLPEVKQAQRPWLRRLVEERAPLDEGFAAASRALEGAGFSPQVSFQRGESPLMLLAGWERRRILWQGPDTFLLRGAKEGPRPVEQLLEAIDTNPSVVTPGVLARPALQDAILGTTLQVLGPAELSYMAQVAPVYRHLEVPAPHTVLRPQTVVLEAHQKGHLEELDLSLEDFLGDRAALDQKLAAREGDFVTPVVEQVAALVDSLQTPSLKVDANLDSPLEKTREQVLRPLENFGKRVSAAVARSNEVQRQRVEALWQTLRPGDGLQERVVASAHFQGKYGAEGVAEAFWRQMDLDPRYLQTIILGDASGKEGA
jgi:bacillithiol biosynthesis cysteine-adding enzyme BshC